MKITSRRNNPLFILEFSQEEIAVLHQWTVHHPDHDCWRAGRPGGIVFSLTRHASQEFDRARIELLCRILTEGPLYEQLAMILAEMDDYATRMALEAFDTGSQNNMEPGLSRAAIERVQERLGDALIEVLKEEESEVSIEILPRPWGFDVLVNVEENL